MSCCTSTNRIQLIQGDTAVFRIAITDADSLPIDLDDFSDILFTVKRSHGDTDQAAVFAGSETNGDLAIVEPSADGLVDVTIPSENTAVMRAGFVYYWDCKLIDGGTDPIGIFTAATGTLFAGMTALQSPS